MIPGYRAKRILLWRALFGYSRIAHRRCDMKVSAEGVFEE
jgi:hypothetical protein